MEFATLSILRILDLEIEVITQAFPHSNWLSAIFKIVPMNLAFIGGALGEEEKITATAIGRNNDVLRWKSSSP